MQKYLSATILAAGLVSGSLYLIVTRPVSAQSHQPAAAAQSHQSTAAPPQGSTEQSLLLPDGKMKVPTGFRAWVFVGAPLTPEGLNDGKYNCDQPGGCTRSNFPEYHHVYIEKKNVDAYLKTGEFPEGTVIVKELTRVLDPMFPDSSRKEPSGRGYFNGAYNGIDMSVKDSKRFPNSNGWGFFTYGHHPMPYAQTAAEQPVAVCAGCHLANVADTDMTWIKFYPLLRDKPGY